MSFIEMWQQAVEADPYWQLEELLEEGEIELANYLWDCQRIAVLVEKRLAIPINQSGIAVKEWE